MNISKFGGVLIKLNKLKIKKVYFGCMGFGAAPVPISQFLVSARWAVTFMIFSHFHFWLIFYRAIATTFYCCQVRRCLRK
jgi:hypothetical protein